MNAEEAPMIHIIHIQKTDPGPPKQIAVDTPMMLPVPTREAVDTSIACSEDTEFSPSDGSNRSFTDSGNSLICTPFVLMVKYNPEAAIMIIRVGKYMKLSS